MRVIIKQDNELVADIPDYQCEVPRKGDYIFHPPLGDQGDTDPHDFSGIAGCVKAVTWGILARPQNGEGHFTGRHQPFVELTI